MKSVLLAGVWALAAFAAAPAQAQKSFPPAIAELLPTAKKEGSVTVYGGGLNPEKTQIINNALNAFYGFDSELKMIVGLHPQKAAELVEGSRIGSKSGIDVFWTASEIAITMEKAGILMPFAWTRAWGLPADMSLGEYGLRFDYSTLASVIYNTDLVKAAEAPRAYKDLLNPKWWRRIAMPMTPLPFIYMSYGIGDRETTEIAKGLMGPQEMQIRPDFAETRDRVITGMFALGLGMNAFMEVNRSLPLQTAPIDPVILLPWAFYIMKDAEHPAMAKLWGWFVIAPEGQKLLDELLAISPLSTKDSAIAKFAAGKKVMVVPHDFVEKEVPARKAKYAEIMGIK